MYVKIKKTVIYFQIKVIDRTILSTYIINYQHPSKYHTKF